MKLCMGIAIISVAIVILLAACLFRERRKSSYWYSRWSKADDLCFDLRKQILDERKHSDMLQKENDLLNKEKANFLHKY